MSPPKKIALTAIPLILLLAAPILLNGTPNQDTPRTLKQKYDKIKMGDTIGQIKKIMRRGPDEPLQTNTQNDDIEVQENLITWHTTPTSKEAQTATLSIFIKQGQQKIHAKSYKTTDPNIPPEEHFLSLKHTIEGRYNGHVFELIGDAPELEEPTTQ